MGMSPDFERATYRKVTRHLIPFLFLCYILSYVGRVHDTLPDAFKSGKVWLLCVVYFGILMGNYFISFWMPQQIKDNFAADPLAYWADLDDTVGHWSDCHDCLGPSLGCDR